MIVNVYIEDVVIEITLESKKDGEHIIVHEVCWICHRIHYDSPLTTGMDKLGLTENSYRNQKYGTN